jgi:hypothetical protein
MIRCRHTKAVLKAKAKDYYKDVENALQLKYKLDRWPQRDLLKPVMVYLRQHIDAIMMGEPKELERQMIEVERRLIKAKRAYQTRPGTKLVTPKGNKAVTTKQTNAALHVWAKKKFITIFDYDNTSNGFVKRSDGALAYAHAKRLDMNTCPYCNVNYTYTMTGKAKSRPQFDHFLNKDRYPYMALSFFNLVPSCQLCNSGALKGEKPFRLSTHLHPFVDDIEDHYQFRLGVSAVDFLLNGNDFTITLEPKKPGGKPADKKRADNSVDVFGIVDRYNYHKDIASDILKKAYTYHPLAIEKIFTGFKINGISIFHDKDEVKQLILGNYLHADHFHKRTLAKLTKDVAEEFGLVL